MIGALIRTIISAFTEMPRWVLGLLCGILLTLAIVGYYEHRRDQECHSRGGLMLKARNRYVCARVEILP